MSYNLIVAICGVNKSIRVSKEEFFRIMNFLEDDHVLRMVKDENIPSGRFCYIAYKDFENCRDIFGELVGAIWIDDNFDEEGLYKVG